MTKILRSNWIARCSKCKTVKRLNRGEEHPMWNDKPLIRCTGESEIGLRCNHQMTARLIKGTTTDHECNAKCMASKGHVCECSCGGENHGKNHG